MENSLLEFPFALPGPRFNSYNHVTNSGFQYDAAGNMTHDASHSYTYDAENRITAVDGGSTATYGYDVDGRRASRVVAGVETDYIYDLSGHVVATYGGGCGNTCWNTGFVYLNGQMVAEYWGGTYFVHADHLGSTRLLTGYPTASVVECDDYYPFGEQVSCGGTSTTTHKFTGYERDSESNLDNAQARYNSSSLGRFMSPDPIGIFVADATNPQTWNLYTYVNNNPLAFTDPTGMDSVTPPPNPCAGDGWSVGPSSCDPMCQETFCGGGVPNQNPTQGDPCVMYPGICNNPIWSYTSGSLPDTSAPPPPDPWCAMGSACYGDLLGFFGYNNPTQIVGTPSGGGGGGTGTGVPQTKQPRLVCAAEKANKASIANAIGTNGKSGFWASVVNGLLGNTVSTVVSYAYGGSNTEFATSAYDTGMGATAGSINAMTGAAPVTEIGGLGTTSAAQISEGVATEGIGGIVTLGKLGYDAISFGYAAAFVCR